MDTSKINGNIFNHISFEGFEFQNSFTSNFSNQNSMNFPELNFEACYLSGTSSTSNEAEKQQNDERKHRRMVSNRESARRSRMRKKRQVNELWSHMLRLKIENHDLMEKFNHVSESHNQTVLENTQLKEETSNLRQMLMFMRFGSSDDDDDLHDVFRGLEEDI